LGFIVGPAIGGFLGGYGLRYPFWASAVLSLANALYGLFVLPESLPKARRSPFSVKRANPIGALKLLRSHPELAGLALAMFLNYNAHESLPSMYVLYTDYRYHFSPQLTGYAFAGVGVGSTIVSAFLISRAIKKLGEVRTLYLGWICGLAGFATLAIAPTTATSLISIPLLSLWGLGSPAMQSLMTRRVDKSAQGQLQGALMSTFGVAGMIAPLVFTQVFGVAISPRWGIHLPGAPYWLAAVLMVGSLIMVASATRQANVGVTTPQAG
jgi:DHA1 family tetracycline resistance protein-like MFS transporter